MAASKTPSAPKISTWVCINAVPTIVEDVKDPKATALRVTADSIVKRSPKGVETNLGDTLNLTLGHLRGIKADPTHQSITYNETTRTLTIKRQEGRKGRRERTATPAVKLAEFVKNA